MINSLPRLFRDTRASTVVTTAMVFPLLIGAAGFGVETAFWYHKDLELQQAADKSVYAAAVQRRAGSNTGKILNAATFVATENGYVPGTLAVHYPPISGERAGDMNAIEIELSIELERYFTNLFFDDNVTEKARAVAILETSANACILALDTSLPHAARFSGSSDVDLIGCTVMSNSMASDAVQVQGAAHLKTDCIIAVGEVDLNAYATMTECAEALVNAPPAADPFEDVPAPDVTSPTYANSNGAFLHPGLYTNGMNLSGNKTLTPGVYVVSGGNFKINANANISGTGVTIYFTSGTSVGINGTATVNLTAPTSGPYAGILFFGDREAVDEVTINGTASSKLTGAIYFKNQHINYAGNFSGLGGCTQVVGRTVEWTGNTTISQDCLAYGMRPAAASQLVKLVE